MNRIVLTGRQRDFLASYPNECDVALECGVQEDDLPCEVVVIALAGVDEAVREVELPPEGFLSQPVVRLHDPEAGLDHIPTALWTPEQIEERRDESLELLPEAVDKAFWLLQYACDEAGLRVDYDDLLEVVRKGLIIEEEEDGESDDDAGEARSE